MPIIATLTGATGFLGRQLVRSLLEDPQVQVRCLVREGSDTEPLLNVIAKENRQRVHCRSGSLSDPQFVRDQFAGSDVVYHLAASMKGTLSSLNSSHEISTHHLIEAAAAAQVGRFVLVSSMGVYGTQSVAQWGTLDESTPIDPHPERRDPYTFNKVQQEAIAQELSRRLGVPLVIVRPGVIYGPGRPVITSRVGLAIGPLLLRMGGEHPLPYTYVENCAAGLKLAGLTPDIEGEIFNLVDDDLPTGNQILDLLKREGKKVRSLRVPHGAIVPLAGLYECCSSLSVGCLPPVLTRYKSAAMWKPVRYSNAKAKHKLNWSPKISTEAGLRQTIAG